MKCYLCNNELVDSNKTKEHIIPNSIGGRLKSETIICRSCNSLFGHTLDKVFEEIPLTTILNIEKERGELQKIKATEKSGRKILIDKNLNPENERIIVEENNGKRVFIIRNKEEARKIIKQHKIKSIENELQRIEWETEQLVDPVILDNDIFSGKEQFRAIARIALSFYYHITSVIEGLSNIISFIKDEIDLYCVCLVHDKNQ